MLRHRVKGYRAGDPERRYESLGIEEDVFVNYGFVIRSVTGLMNVRPRGSSAHVHGLAFLVQVPNFPTSLNPFLFLSVLQPRGVLSECCSQSNLRENPPGEALRRLEGTCGPFSKLVPRRGFRS